MTTVTLEHVSKQYTALDGVEGRPIQAVRDVTLKLQSGDVLAILGPSGCGKSTLLRLIAGLLKPDSGCILYDDENLQNIPLQDRGVGMVFQEGALVPHWENRKSVSFFLRLRRREQEVPERLRQISKITGIGLEKLLDRKPGEVSGGERQRVSIARALARDLKVLLFDEPFHHLDAQYRAEARVELKRLLNAFPVTSVYVTHDQVEAVALSHRIAVMRDGRLEQVGTYQQLYDRPHNLFVATFIGSQPINLLRGHIIEGQWRGVNFGGLAARRDLEDGMPAILGIRPEHIHLANGGVSGRVEAITPYLAERYQLVEVRANGERWLMTVPLDQRLERGMTISCAVDPAAALLFDPKTELRIG